jgi:NADH-quinone oxidoreductase subunit I
MLQAVKQSWTTFKSIFTGMRITGGHLVGPTVTLQYPEERMELPKNARARLFVNIDDCIGCFLCAKACPVNCIDIETVPATADVDLGKTSTGNPKRFHLTRFNIDMAKCMYCDLCTHPCPTSCIFMEQEYEYSTYDRAELVYKFSNVVPDQIDDLKAKAEAEAAEKQRQKEEAARLKAEEVRLKKEQEAAAKAKAEAEVAAAAATKPEAPADITPGTDTKAAPSTEATPEKIAATKPEAPADITPGTDTKAAPSAEATPEKIAATKPDETPSEKAPTAKSDIPADSAPASDAKADTPNPSPKGDA